MKVDKELSNRRKLITTLWMGVVVVIVPIICYLLKLPTKISITIILIVLALWSILLVYHIVRYFLEI